MMDGCGYPTKWAGRDYRVGEQEKVGEMGVAQTKSGNYHIFSTGGAVDRNFCIDLWVNGMQFI